MSQRNGLASSARSASCYLSRFGCFVWHRRERVAFTCLPTCTDYHDSACAERLSNLDKSRISISGRAQCCIYLLAGVQVKSYKAYLLLRRSNIENTCACAYAENRCIVMVENEEESDLADWEGESCDTCLQEWIPYIGRCSVRRGAGDRGDVGISDSALFVLYCDEARDCNAAGGHDDIEVQVQPFLAYVVVCKGFLPEAELEMAPLSTRKKHGMERLMALINNCRVFYVALLRYLREGKEEDCY